MLETPDNESRKDELKQVLVRARTRAATSGLTREVARLKIFASEDRMPINIPGGAPTTLNPEISMVGVGRRRSNDGSAPFAVPLPGKSMRARLDHHRVLPQDVSFRKICAKCRRGKTDHTGLRCSNFGPKKCNWTS